ncbi:SH3 domain-containing protein [Fulvimarina endophytica]|uniref:SH3 domain-containing protein n=1 Tax=Fulvimarina endophytica TaxID=2293836 RepID=A0A371X1B7_9HYPH|nr:SH3 domain-containing protein [Fulvimarina endophytica]RFC62977.1 SH3 domain-containing protein [Fulvimarina endophytica]
MKRLLFSTALLLGLAAAPTLGQAAEKAIATADVNLRAGPSTSYPAVDIVGGGERVRVFGCLQTRSWCDVAFRGARGWMSSNYLAYLGQDRRYQGTRAVEIIAAPVITFEVGGYWDDHYRDRSFYRDRDRWQRRGGEGWAGRDRDDRWSDRDGRYERGDDRFGRRGDWRDDRGRDRRDARRYEERFEPRDSRRFEGGWDRYNDRPAYRDRPVSRPEPVVPLYRVN